jgi:hypothetical protein
MTGLRSNFGQSLALVAIVAAIAVVAALVAARRASAGGSSPLGPAARILAAGAVGAMIVSTALPRRLAIETDGDLVLELGRGGLGDWRVLFDDPNSLASVELIGNVLLYVPIGLTMTLGWFRQRRFVLPACIALSLLIEAAQYTVLGRVAALDDVLLNAAGAALGILIAWALTRSGALDAEA